MFLFGEECKERLIRRAVYILTDAWWHVLHASRHSLHVGKIQEDFLAPKYPPLVPLTSRWPLGCKSACSIS